MFGDEISDRPSIIMHKSTVNVFWLYNAKNLCLFSKRHVSRRSAAQNQKRHEKKVSAVGPGRANESVRTVLVLEKNAIFNGDVQILNSVRCRTVVFGNRFLPVSNITSWQLIIIAIWTVHGAINRKSLLLLITIIIKKYFLSSPRLQRNTFRRCVLGHWNKTMRGAVA